MEPEELLHAVREARLTTLALADQVPDERWRESALPGGSLHDVLAHMLGWDEWTIAILEVSRSRALPEVLSRTMADVDGFNARTMKRLRSVEREDLLTAMQTATERLMSAAVATGAGWEVRRIEGIVTEDGAEPRSMSVRTVLRIILNHEQEHDGEIADSFGISANLDRFREEAAPAEG
jgi:uncharacterized damage-inducible protein DinB